MAWLFAFIALWLWLDRGSKKADAQKQMVDECIAAMEKCASTMQHCADVIELQYQMLNPPSGGEPAAAHRSALASEIRSHADNVVSLAQARRK